MSTLGEEIVFTKYPAKVGPCDPDQDFRQDLNMVQGYFAQNVTRFTCLDNSDIFFQGTTVSPLHSYLHFELLACEEQALR